MSKLTQLARWLIAILIGALFILLFEKPYLFGFGDDPSLLRSFDEVMVNENGAPFGEGVSLESKFGCKFWKYQRDFLEIEATRFDAYYQQHKRSVEFLSKYDEMHRELEKKLLSKNGVNKILVHSEGDLEKLLITVVERDLQKLESEKERHIHEQEYWLNRANQKKESSRKAQGLLKIISIKHRDCFTTV